MTVSVGEVMVAAMGPDGWAQTNLPGLQTKLLWQSEDGRGSIALIKFAKGSGIPREHVHASTQSMFCLSGRYAYVASGLVLEPGSFYSNPKDHPHGPTEALEESILLEVHDGPRFYEQPEYLQGGDASE